jgi:hypothetical protein
MAQTFLNLAQGVTGTLPTSNYVQGGITEADQWRITANVTGDQQPLSSNWERADTDGFGKIGTGLSQSSGVYSFPSTGVWFITFQFVHQFDNTDGITYFDIATTSDGSSFNRISRADQGGGGGDYHTGYVNCIFDCTNVSTHKCRFDVSSTTSGNTTIGSSSQNKTSVTFIRLGDT